MNAATSSDMADRQAIASLIATYAHAVDARDVRRIVSCFTSDTHVEFDNGAEVVDGRDDLTRFFERALVAPRMGRAGVSTHQMSDLLIDLDDDAAHVETQAVAYLASAARTTVVVRGLRYSDDCVRHGDRWLIARRSHRSLWQAEMPGGPIGTASP
jgi:ketosteroid isomerase-like protein